MKYGWVTTTRMATTRMATTPNKPLSAARFLASPGFSDMRVLVSAWPVLGAVLSSGAVLAQPLPGGWEVSAGVQQRTLRERNASHAVIVTERGPMARAGARRKLSGGRVELRLEAAHGLLDYGGRTQSGMPLSTHTTHTEVEAGLRWRAWDPQSWGELHWGVDGLRNRRSIAGTAAVGGLLETGTWLMPAVEWRSASFDGPGFGWQAQARLRASAYERLRVEFGGVYDATRIAGGPRTDAELRLEAWTSGPWRWGLAWNHAVQRASAEAPLYRGGNPAGTLRQPDLRIDDVQLSVKRSF